jgi:hypothetical protein
MSEIIRTLGGYDRKVSMTDLCAHKLALSPSSRVLGAGDRLSSAPNEGGGFRHHKRTQVGVSRRDIFDSVSRQHPFQKSKVDLLTLSSQKTKARILYDFLRSE